MSDYRIISSDDHITEPPDLWTGRSDSTFKDRVPRIVRLDDGGDWWVTDGIVGQTMASASKTGERFEGNENLTIVDQFEQVRPGAYDPDERVKDMDLDGVDVSVIYPNQGLMLYAVPDTELLNSVLVTYNDWLAEFCGAYPRRLKGIAMINLDDVEWGVKELKRCHGIGLVGGMVPVYPPQGRSYDLSEYEPFWEAADQLNMPISLHVDTNRKGLPGQETTERVQMLQPDTVVNMVTWIKTTLAKMIMGGVFERFPTLQIGSVEHELAWVPYFLERLDYVYTQRFRMDHWHRFKEDMLPSDYLHRNVFLGFQEDGLGIRLRDIIGVDSLQWGSDYPHQESTFPRSRQILEEILADCSEDEKAKIAGGNAASLYHLN